MDFMSNLLIPAQWPSGVWESIIKGFAGVGSIGLAIILLTICLKVLLLPLDFWQRLVSRKMSVQQSLMQPELEEIKKKYGNNQQLIQQKQAELYKKYNMSPTNSCLAMLVYMVITLVVFFTLFSGLNNISRTQINYEYYQLQQEYVAVYNETGDQEEAQNRVVVKYDDIREGFLTIKNIWRPDNWSSVFPTSSEFISSTKTEFKLFNYNNGEIKYIYLSTNSEVLKDSAEKEYVEPYVDLNGRIYAVKGEGGELATLTLGDETYSNIVYGVVDETNTTEDAATLAAAKTQFEQDFTLVTAKINEKYAGQWNGYLVFVILAAAITFLSSWFSTAGIKAKDKKGNIVKNAKPKPFMGIILAFVMVMFTISYTSAFAIYIVANSAISMLFTYLINLLINKIENKKESKDTKIADYVRR